MLNGRAWELARPFTLIAPALGMFTGSIIALGAAPAVPLTQWVVIRIILGTLMAAVLILIAVYAKVIGTEKLTG